MSTATRAASRAAPTLLALLLALSALSAVPASDTFTGTITDDTCAKAGHAQMRMGPTDAECTRFCVMFHDGAYVLQDGETVYQLSDQKRAAEFAAQKVRVTGTLDATTRTIHVEAIAAAD
jgi:hypothetical protein